MPEVTITIDGKKVTATQGTLLIDVCKRAGIEIPSFCYYPGLSLQGACRMCLVEIARTPKLQTACTTTVTDGMVVTTNSDLVKQSRKAMLEFVLQNHPLDCPVCDAGGQCELQDATLTCGPAESKLVDIKNHRDEQKWSSIVFFDRPRCIMCYRCVRVCGEGMDVWALGIANRNSSQLIVPNKQDHLECEECGMCIDICPVGALTSGPYRYKTRPWEMKHVATVCTHCADGCTTTLGVRPVEGRMVITRGSNRDKAGINGDFLCIKGRYGFDFVNHAGRLTRPLMRIDGALREVPWHKAIQEIANKVNEIRTIPGAAGVIGSNHSTNEENYMLQKFARTILNTNNIDHRRTADFSGFIQALRENGASTASMTDIAKAPAILLIGADPTYQHPLLAWQIRGNVRLNGARLYILNTREIKLCRQARQFVQANSRTELRKVVEYLSSSSEHMQSEFGEIGTRLVEFAAALKQEPSMVIAFGSELVGNDIASLVRFGKNLPHATFICLGDGANSRGASDMGVLPNLLPGYETNRERWEKFWNCPIPSLKGRDVLGMFQAAEAGELPFLHVVGSDPIKEYALPPQTFRSSFVVVQDLFLTATGEIADVVLPSLSPYETTGSFTNTCGDLQVLRKAADQIGPRSDLDILLLIAETVGADITPYRGTGPGVRAEFGQSRGAQSGEVDRQAIWTRSHISDMRVSSFNPDRVLQEIQEAIPGYSVPHVLFNAESLAGSAPERDPGLDQLIRPFGEDLFSSEAYSAWSPNLHSVLERDIALPYEAEPGAD